MWDALSPVPASFYLSLSLLAMFGRLFSGCAGECVSRTATQLVCCWRSTEMCEIVDLPGNLNSTWTGEFVESHRVFHFTVGLQWMNETNPFLGESSDGIRLSNFICIFVYESAKHWTPLFLTFLCMKTRHHKSMQCVIISLSPSSKQLLKLFISYASSYEYTSADLWWLYLPTSKPPSGLASEGGYEGLIIWSELLNYSRINLPVDEPKHG